MSNYARREKRKKWKLRFTKITMILEKIFFSKIMEFSLRIITPVIALIVLFTATYVQKNLSVENSKQNRNREKYSYIYSSGFTTSLYEIKDNNGTSRRVDSPCIIINVKSGLFHRISVISYNGESIQKLSTVNTELIYDKYGKEDTLEKYIVTLTNAHTENISWIDKDNCINYYFLYSEGLNGTKNLDMVTETINFIENKVRYNFYYDIDILNCYSKDTLSQIEVTMFDAYKKLFELLKSDGIL